MNAEGEGGEGGRLTSPRPFKLSVCKMEFAFLLDTVLFICGPLQD